MTTPNPNRFSDAAALGLRLFPCKARGKEPIGPWAKYRQQAPTPEELEGWDASEFNVAIICGAPSDIIVLDVDSAEAQDLVDSFDPPQTPTVRTARGCHLYFKRPEHPVRNAVHIHGVKLDLRGDGGYVIGPGSVHPDGMRYEWTISPAETPFAPFPANLAALLNKSSRPPAAGGPNAPDFDPTGLEGLDRFLARALAHAQTEIEKAPDGDRNNTLFKWSVRVAEHVAAAQLGWSPFEEALGQAAATAGQTVGEIKGTLASAWRTGSSTPTKWIQVSREHVYLSYQERFYHLPSGKDLKPSGFNGQYGDLYFGKGTFANHLLNAGLVRKVFDLTYDPLDDRRFIERRGLEWLNTFKPSTVVSAAGDPAPFLNFLEALVPLQEEREHLLKMMAYTVRNPGRKLRYALLLRTAIQGVGKSMLTEIWGRLLGVHNVRKTSSKELASDYQGYLPQTLMVVCEEMNLGMGARAYNDLKDMITGDTALINEKYLSQREWPVYANFVFLTNLEVPIFIEDTDRRIFFIDSPAVRRSPAYYREFADWWRGSLGIIRRLLDEVDLHDFNPYESPPMTASKIALIAGSQSELAKDMALLLIERQGCFDRDIVMLDQVRFELGHIGRMKTRSQLTKALKDVGAVSLGQQRVHSGRASLWAIRNVRYWEHADGVTRAEEFKRAVGAFEGLDGSGMEVAHFNEWPGDPSLLPPAEARAA